MDNTLADPRFEEFELHSDNGGFTIYENGQVIDFFFDPEGGWFDEHNNYFN